MNKKYIIVCLISCFIISTLFSYTVFAKKKSKKQSCTITVKVYDMDTSFNQYASTYPEKNYDKAWLDFTQAIGLKEKIYSAEKSKNEKSTIYDMGWKAAREKEIFSAGKYAFGFNQKDVKCSPSLSGGYGEYSKKLSLTNGTTHKFTFPDNKNVQLVIAAYNSEGTDKGGIMGQIEYQENITFTDGGTSQNSVGLVKQQQYKSTDWYRKTAKENVYTSGNLTISQNADSSTVEITNVGQDTSASDITVNVYISKTAIDIDLGNAPGVSSTTINGGILKGTSDQNDGTKNPEKNKNGTADNYNVQTTYKPQQDVFNNWKVVQSYVNRLIDTIEILSNAYYGFAFITCILMLIINIVAVAGSVNNPMYRTRIFLQLGVSVLCLALLGASYLLTRLFILTCMGT